jgi:hypothetical protein
MTVPIKSRVIHQNGESAADKEHQKKEVHKMGQPQPPGETVRNWRTLQIDWRQESLRWKPGNQILSPRNRDWSESDNGKRKNEPGIYPDTKTAIQRIVDSLMDFVECRHKEMVSTVNQVPLLGIYALVADLRQAVNSNIIILSFLFAAGIWPKACLKNRSQRDQHGC